MRDLNINNFRDVSGYINADGKCMKENMIFRGASLHAITYEDALYLNKELGIKYILDYRDEREASAKKDITCEDMEYIRISALITSNQAFQGFDFGDLLSKGMTKDNLKFMLDYLADGYACMAFNNPAYHKLFEVMLKNDGNIYFHCSAGKDRTGISAFLIMIALSMSEEDAIKEYLKSNDSLQSFVEAFYREKNIPDQYKAYADKLLYVCEENIRLTISKIREKYDDYDTFLKEEYHLTKEKRDILKSIYCK